MEMSFPELLDRFSILLQKRMFLDVDTTDEYNVLKASLSEHIKSSQMTVELVEELIKASLANAHIWSLESDLKNDNLENLMYQEVGRRALKIRSLNKIRVESKNKISELTKSGFKDIKKDHASEPLGTRGY
jgi:hypothetical protein